MSPSKMPRKIDILKELRRSVREWLRFIDFGLPYLLLLGASKMAPKFFSAISAQQAQASQLSSASSAQPVQVKIVLQSRTGAGLTQNRLSGRSLKRFVVVFWGALKTWIWRVSQLSSATESQPP